MKTQGAWRRFVCWLRGHDFPLRNYRDSEGMKAGYYDRCKCGAWR